MLRTAVLSFWHVHGVDHAREAIEHPDTELAAVWDEDAERGAEHADRYGVEFVADLDALLSRDDIDAVLVATATSVHVPVIRAAARAGKHVYTEKVLAATSAEVDEILGEIERAGVILGVSLPRLAMPYVRAIADVLATGEIGRLTSTRVRVSHGGAVRDWLPERFYDPEAACGGVVIDLGAHPLYLTNLFHGGLPESVVAALGHVTGRAVEDNASVLMSYAGGAVGVVEAGFVTSGPVTAIEVHGTQGSLAYRDIDSRLLLRAASTEDRWAELPLPSAGPSPFERWVSHVRQGVPDDEIVSAAVGLTRVVEAAYASARTGEAVAIVA